MMMMMMMIDCPKVFLPYKLQFLNSAGVISLRLKSSHITALEVLKVPQTGLSRGSSWIVLRAILIKVESYRFLSSFSDAPQNF